MCGIIGIVGATPVQDRLIESLKRLEYRGYDSAGIAAVVGGKVERRRAEGKIRALEAVLAAAPLGGSVGIGHTRWATHGAPSLRNAHPHTQGRVTLVHNGIIENYAELRERLQATGRAFESETDTEVIAALLDSELATGLAPIAALKATLDQLSGAYALGVLVEGEDGLIMGARRGSPLVVGYGDGEMFLGSDALAVGPFTNRVCYLEEGDFVAITHTGAKIFDQAGQPVERPVRTVPASAALVEKGNYRHFMEKEIHDQPEGCQRTIAAYVDTLSAITAIPGGVDFANLGRIQIVACGTSYIAGLLGKYLIEQLADLPVDVEIASEFRYRQPALQADALVIAMSQSGETADTLAALRYCQAKGMRSAAVVNAVESTMAREVDVVWPIHCGPEIGVASTKAFTAQICVLTALAVAAARARGRIDEAEEQRLVRVLLEAPRLVAESIELKEAVQRVAVEVSKARDVLYLGRGPMYPLSLEGALKLKEISYIHAEGYAAGELKHGPIALVDENTPIVILAPFDSYFEKSASNMNEVMARGGQVIFITDPEGQKHAPAGARVVVTAPRCDPLIAPLVYSPPMQLLAYHVAVLKGADVDQPRNLAKSVTVE
ncbi:MAG: glutamine--fructose-6-phosphate transaminase (isomerizing) [Alphaproteobacteria bacterium]|nr:glutamine--fructose-6-phosphate transaminase (isomerizing) [Alphaproteobacteria bacterium]MBU1514382.1 glutamine--fructose-6-phosphate transaminase (isomerizing) [Alphaproteobacteria bacterium]MBU2096026.1 glutamine--fructose-6-phosphate transaminase (isomerizing) [Alphaproteobacteria bacterium]MBU2150068.1 glutamine--fructose-6-phosphate transaminase (isomerizing) [Alphaproteobacteria bacterium]MBU2308581.1 glutamine--fructose-6-phosphate transaminase (isomerizing) [Alphaproteobacteria bact